MQPLPSPPGWYPLVGHLVTYLRDPMPFLETASRLGPLVDIDFPGSLASVMVNDPELVEDVLVTNNRSYGKDTFTRDLKRVLGQGLLTSEGDFWRRQRRLAQPAFHKERIAGYANTMVAATEAELSRWRDGEERDVHADMMHLTLEIVGKTLFGADVASRAKEIGAGLEAVVARYTDPIALAVPQWDRLPTPLNKRFRAGVAQLDRIMRELIQSHRAGVTGDGKDLLSMLLAARDDDGSGMSDDQLRDETITLILAGHETTAIALSWTWMLLAQNPHVRKKLEEELARVLGGRSPTHADLPKLEYADRVMRESMRLYPPAWSVGREALVDVELGGRRFPKGTQLWIVQWTMHRDTRFFQDPERFDPDRWVSDLAKRLPKYAYFPFGGGPRLCIGNAFAQMEGVLLLATIAQRHRLDLTSDAKLALLPSVTLRPKHGVRVRVSARADQRAEVSAIAP